MTSRMTSRTTSRMNRRPPMTLVGFLFSLVLAFCGCDRERSNDGRLTVAVIPKGTTQEFWKSVQAGANKAADELDVDIVWQGPTKQDDSDQQVGVLESMIVRGVDAIVVAPVDDVALMAPIEDAMRQKIPVVIIDSGLKSEEYVSFIATDNYQGGVVAAHHLAQLLEKKGKLIVLRNQIGSASTMNRESGFLDTLKKDYSDVEVVSSEQRAGSTTALAYEKAEQLLARFTTADGGFSVDAIFTSCEPVTFGMLRAMLDAKLVGKVKHVGFDASPQLVRGLRAQHIDALVVQDPFRMGYDGVKTVCAHLGGSSVERRIDTGVHLVTPSNMDDRKNKELLEPELDRWLKGR